MTSTFSVSFDPQSLATIAQMHGLNILLAPPVQAAMSQGGDLLVTAAVANTWAKFKNPTGYLASTIHKVTNTPFELQVGSDDPKAHRREVGFSGQTDRLGRYYPHDPGIFYFQDAMGQEGQAILQLIDNAVAQVLGGL